MQTHHEDAARQSTNPWRLAIWGGAALLLALPWIAMQFTAEVDWMPGDFLVFGSMLAAAAGGYELATWRSANRAYRAGFALALATAFLLTWANLAVGIVGREDNPANLLFLAVIAVGAAGSMLARLRARGMARALVATALAQALAGAVAILAMGAPAGLTLAVTLLFVALWFAAASAFAKAAAHAVST